MKLQIAICDDEKIILENIRERLLQYKPEYAIDLYQSGKKLLEAKKEYDLIFLDIEMPEMDGMKVAVELRNKKYDGHLVFLTSHTEFMPDAFKVKAFRFLKKPISDTDFTEMLEESEKEIIDNKRIVIHTSVGEKMLNIKDIICLETVRNYTYVFTKSGEIETRKSLQEWLNILGNEHFCHVHKSYVISLRYIEKIDDEGIAMKYMDMRIPIARRKTSEVKKIFFEYVRKQALLV